MNLQKQPRWRSKTYRDFVKTLPCCCCAALADEPHHLKGIGKLSGSGLTAPDWATMPVCRICHDDLHKKPLIAQWEWALRTLGRALDEGVIK